MTEIEIGGRTIPLMLTTYELIAIQDEVGCTIGQIKENIFGIEHNLETDEYTFSMMKDKEKMKRFGTLLRIIGNAGLEEKGEEPDLTDKWILRHIRPAQIVPFMMIVTEVINDAMKIENIQKNDGPVDEKLEEDNAKKEQRSIPTGESAPTDSLPD